MSDNGTPGIGFARSAESLAFEQMWRRLPRTGRIPERRAFQPRLAKDFLRNIILAQAPSLGDTTVRVRLVGEEIRATTTLDLVGQDFLDAIDGEGRRENALTIIQQMFEKPCGVWWVAPVHYERGYSHYWELTAFPLAAWERSPAMVVAFIRPFSGSFDTHDTNGKAIRLDPAARLEIIDASS